MIPSSAQRGAELYNELTTDKRFLPFLEEQRTSWHGAFKKPVKIPGNYPVQTAFSIETTGATLPFFQRHRLDVELIYAFGAEANVAALIQRDLDFVECAGASVVPGMMAASEIFLIANFLQGNPYRLVTVPELLAHDPPPAGQQLPPNLGGD